MRPTKSTTSSSAKALSSESIGTAWRTLAKRARRRRADALRQAVGVRELRKARLDRRVATAQLVVFGVGDGRRVFLIVAAVVRGDLFGQPRVLGLRLLFGEGSTGSSRYPWMP